LPIETLPKFDNYIEVKDIKRFRITKTPLYTESEIVDKMRREGIGRLSTYAIILETLFKRKYIGSSQYKKKVFPLKKGIDAYNTLIKELEKYAQKLKSKSEELVDELRKIITVEGTRTLEKEMDLIETGKIEYRNVLEKMYNVLEKMYNALKIIMKDLRKYYFSVLIPSISKQEKTS